MGVTRTAFSTHDPELAHEFLGSVYAGHTVRLAGGRDDFVFRHTMTGGPGFALARVRHTGYVQFDAQPVEDVLNVTVFHRGPAEISSGGETVRAGPGEALLTPTAAMRTWWDDLDNTTVVLDAGAVADHAAAVAGVDPDGLAFLGMRPLSPGLAHHWQATVAHIGDHLLLHADAAGPLVLADAFSRLATAVLTVFANTADTRTGSAGPTAVRRAAQHIEAHAGDPVSPVDLAAATGVPYCDLSHAFRRRQGRSPVQQLWRARLEGAHRDLREADPTHATVAGIAARWGFPDPARFAVIYHAAYDHTPQQTLSR